jgi:hypothetical protein
VGITKKGGTFKEVGVIKKPGLGEGPNPGLEDERGEFEIRGRPELLGLGRYPVPSYGGVSTGIIRWCCGEGGVFGGVVCGGSIRFIIVSYGGVSLHIQAEL